MVSVRSLWLGMVVSLGVAVAAAAALSKASGMPLQKARYGTLVATALEVTDAERTLIADHGFVFAGRLQRRTFTTAHAEIFWRDLPIWITVDSLFDAWHQNADGALAVLERRWVVPGLASVLAKWHEGLPPCDDPDVCVAERRADLWFTVARRLLASSWTQPAPKYPGQAGEVHCAAALVHRVARSRVFIPTPEAAEVDCTAVDRAYLPEATRSLFIPVGRYARSFSLRSLFMAVRWLQVEAPRMIQDGAVDAEGWAFGAAVARAATAGVLEAWRELEGRWRRLSGPAAGATPDDLVALVRALGAVPPADARQVFDKLATLQRERGARGAPPHEAGGVFAYGATLDFALVMPRVMHENLAFERSFEVDSSRYPHAMEGLWVLGFDRARDAVAPGAQLETVLNEARGTVARSLVADTSASVRTLTLQAIQSLAVEDPRLPKALRTDAWRDRRLHAATMAWTQLRHDDVLMVPPSTGSIVCEFPDAYVDPYPETFRRLAELAESLILAFEVLDTPVPFETQMLDQLRSYAKVTRRLAGLAEKSLEGQRPDAADLAWINEMIRVHQKGTVCGPPELVWNGWWAGMQPSDSASFLETASVALHVDGTSTQLSTGPVFLAIAVVDRPGGPTAYVGAVRSMHATHEAGAGLTDEEWLVRVYREPQPPTPWSAYLWSDPDGVGTLGRSPMPEPTPEFLAMPLVSAPRPAPIELEPPFTLP